MQSRMPIDNPTLGGMTVEKSPLRLMTSGQNV
jgi:hypothetical protein